MVETSQTASNAAETATSNQGRRGVQEASAAAVASETVAAVAASELRTLLASVNLTAADLQAHGSTLIAHLPDGRVLVVRGYFAGPDLGLPPEVAASGAQIIAVEAADFSAYVNEIDGATGDDEIGDAGDDDEDLENFETAAGGDGEVDPALAALLAADPELAALFAAVGLDGLLAALGIDPVDPEGDLIIPDSDFIPPDVIIGSPGPDDLLRDPNGPNFPSPDNPPLADPDPDDDPFSVLESPTGDPALDTLLAI